jgi:hypothetical protein
MKIRESRGGDHGGKVVKPCEYEKQMEFLPNYRPIAGSSQTSNLSPNV